jgi:hypothetical protein
MGIIGSQRHMDITSWRLEHQRRNGKELSTGISARHLYDMPTIVQLGESNPSFTFTAEQRSCLAVG